MSKRDKQSRRYEQMSKLTFLDLEAQIPSKLRNRKTALGATFNTGCESSATAINEHNETELQNTLPEYFKTLATLTNRSLHYFFVVEHHPTPAAYQTHCHGICSDLSDAEQVIAKLLWTWFYYNRNFLNAGIELSAEQRKKYRVKETIPSLYFKQESPIAETVNYALKQCVSENHVSSISGVGAYNMRVNQKWYAYAAKVCNSHMPGHWLDVVERAARPYVSLDSFCEFAMCYLLAFKRQVEMRMETE